MSTRTRHSPAVERGMLHLIRLVLADDWDQASASHHLLEVVRDPRVLRRMANRVESAIAERASEMDRRAALTLRAALHAASQRPVSSEPQSATA